MTQEFEESIPSVTKADTRHHEQVPGVQVLFKKDVASLVSSFEEVGNPFEEDSKDLFALDSKVIVENAVIQTVKNTITIGQEQYNTFVEDQFEKRTKEVTSVISNNRLPLFKSPLEQKSDKKVQVAALKDDCALFSRLYIACQSREGNLQEFFKHENHPWPSSLTPASTLREGQKSDLVKCMEKASAEYPLPIYVALEIHGETRKKSLIDAFFNMGLCISSNAACSNRLRHCFLLFWQRQTNSMGYLERLPCSN